VAKKSTKKKKHTVDPEQNALLASRSLACELARLADDRHCRDIVILELAHLCPVAHHFVIATGTSDQQIRSVAREMEDLGRQQNSQVFNHAGLRQGRWAVLDFIDVVVHLFDDEFRIYYDLELLWGDAPKINWHRPNNVAPQNTDKDPEKIDKDL
jgi:ribosome-associated protein